MLDAVLRLRADKRIAAGSCLVGPKVRSTGTVKRYLDCEILDLRFILQMNLGALIFV
ncbi:MULTISPECIES: hypothetical protein [unclassified Microcoleus]|uniref:hypothetical protein n=1 Tax=unclassified Microcoleus TaxID=2642155 RepID=UPI0025F87410|nr:MULTISPECIES: hypothetical protein [unclassified Microcoleus]